MDYFYELNTIKDPKEKKFLPGSGAPTAFNRVTPGSSNNQSGVASAAGTAAGIPSSRRVPGGNFNLPVDTRKQNRRAGV